jgi:internalin A
MKTRIIVKSLAVVGIITLLLAAVATVTAQTVNFPDPNLEAVVREALPNPTGPISTDDMLTLTNLNANGRDIHDLTGLETALNLQDLQVEWNPITNHTAISALTNLVSLSVSANGTPNISFVAPLKKLQNLNLYSNGIQDLSPLAGLMDLQTLFMPWNPATNFATLSALTNLVELDIGHSGVTNLDFIAPLKKLQNLSLDNDGVPDISALAGRTNLLTLNLNWNGVTNPAVLASLTGLQELHLPGNNLTNVPYLASLTNLTGLDLAYTALADMSPLTNLTRLVWLNVGENSLTNLPDLSPLDYLLTFMMAGNQITDLSPITRLPVVSQLHLQRNPFQDLSPLTNCPYLYILLFYDNHAITNLPVLGAITNLEVLQLEAMQITNLSQIDFLATLPGLWQLDLYQNHITDLSPLTNYPNLNWLGVEENRLQQIAPLLDMPALGYVNLRNNYLDTNATSAAWNVITNLQGRGVTVEFDPQLEVPILPHILIQPASRSAFVGDTAVFIVSLEKNGPWPEFRWQKDGVDLENDSRISGADNDTLAIAGLIAEDTGHYSVRVWRDWAVTNSTTAGLLVVTNVAFTDANLEAAVRVALDIPTNPLTPGDLAGLYSLDASSRGITNLSGLEAAANLVGLDLSGNPGLADFTPLTFLSALNALSLNSCGLTDVSPLSNLRTLNGLELNDNFILDLSPLRPLDSLVSLSVSGNYLTAIEPMLDLDALGFANIANNYLVTNAASAAWNVITNLQARGVTVEFDPQFAAPVQPVILAQPRNCSALPGSNITFTVVVTGGTPAASFRWQRNGMDLADDSRISGAATDTLQITGVSTADAGVYRVRVWDPWFTTNSLTAQLMIITNVVFADPNLEAAVRDQLGILGGELTTADLATMTSLDAGGRSITNLSGLEAAVNLNWLRLADNRGIQSFEPLTYLSVLNVLFVDGCGLSDLSGIARLTRLGHLGIGNNLIQDLSPLRTLTGLNYLWAERNHLAVIDPLLDLTVLSVVNVEANHLDTNATSAAWNVITNLMARGADVDFDPQYFPQAVPVIIAQPASRVAFPGDYISFLVEATGSGSGLSYLWQKNGLNLQDGGHTFNTGGNELYVDDVGATEAGSYRVEVWDEFGLTNSITVTLRVVTNVAFVDPNLERAVRDRLGIPTDPLTPADLAPMTWLNADNYGITNLSGIESAANLDWLSLDSNSGITNFAPLFQLPRLAFLNLNSCAVSNLDFVAALPPLNELHVWGGTFTDISPLAAQPRLLRLNLGNNRGITNLAVLNSLTLLENLYIDSMGLTNLDFVLNMPHLVELSVWDNAVLDLTPLTAVTNLMNLNLGANHLTNVTLLAACTNLETLGLGANQITDLSFVTSLPRLWYLNINDNPIPDLSLLTGRTNLTQLDIGLTLATNLAPVATLTGLTDFHAWQLGLSNNLGFLASLTNLQVLGLGNNSITTLPPYPHLNQLRWLNLENNPLASLSFAAGMTNLTDLYLSGTGVSDLSPLAGHTNLTSLSLANNGITDISLLATLTHLSWVTLWNNQVQDISALSGLTSLTYVDLRYNLLNVAPGSAARTVIQTLQGRGATVDYLEQKVWLAAPARVGGLFQFTVQSTPGAVLEIWSSTTLTNWTWLGYVTNTTGAATFTDSSTPTDQKFYRAQQP